MEVPEGPHVANTPCDGALLGCGGALVCLTFNTWVDELHLEGTWKDARTQVHDMVSADGTIVHHNIPGPKGNGVPLDWVSIMIAPYVWGR